MECDDTEAQYTGLKKPGLAVIHLGLGLACRCVGQLPSPIPDGMVRATAKSLKTFIEGFAYHEIGHLLYSDMTGSAVTAIDPKYIPFLAFIKDMMNVMEDPKMERLMAKDLIYKFTRPYFAILTKKLFIPQAQKYVDRGTVSDFVNYILLWLRCGPKVLTAHNKMFDSLVPKGICEKIRECHRENDGMKRAKKQAAFAVWLIDELGLKSKDIQSRVTPERPVIIIVDKTPGGTNQPKPLMPKDASLPPVSIAEAGDDDGDGDSGEQPEADVIDARKNKPEPKGKDEKPDKQGSGKSSQEKESEGEEGTEGEKADEKPTETNDEPSKDGTGSKEQGADDKTDDKADDGNSGTEPDGEGEDDQSSSPTPNDGSRSLAGHGMGPKQAPPKPSKDFDWEFGNENPIEILEEDALLSSPDPDLESALDVEDDANDSHAYEARMDYEVDSPELAYGQYARCAAGLGSVPATLADVIKQLKAESADYERHLLSDGEEIDVDDYLDVLASGSTSLDVYRDDVKGREITDLAVSVLVDCSASMMGRKSKFAYATSVLVSLACEEAEVPCEFAAFSTQGVMYLKHFEEKREDAADILGMFSDDERYNYSPVTVDTLRMWGGTELEEALPIVLGNLRKYEEKQAKLLFIITDGDTGNVAKTGQLVREAREEGIVVIGIGVGTSEANLRACFDHCKSFGTDSLQKLPEYIAEQIEGAISSDNLSGF